MVSYNMLFKVSTITIPLHLVETGFVNQLNDRPNLLLFRSGKSFHEKVQAKPRSAIRYFLRWLGRDQNLVGNHRGQFGKRASFKEERLFLTGAENLKVKPRLYLTGWTCFILSELKLGERYLNRAAHGIEVLLQEGIVKVYQGATSKTPPDRQPEIVSYRHTIRADQILSVLNYDMKTVAEVLGRMLDERNGWQNSEGGWAQCDEEFIESELWASTYITGYKYFTRQLPR